MPTQKEWESEKRVIDIEVSKPALLRVATFYYPGWEASLDRKEVPIKIEQPSGAMLVEVPEGTHTLELRFLDTPLRYYARLISFLSLFFMVLLIYFFRHTGRTEQPIRDNP